MVFIGGWQLATALGWVDKFFFGQPSEDLGRPGAPVHPGHGLRLDLGEHVGDDLKEAVYGFFLGTGAGVVLGLLLGQNRFLSDVLGPYIKIVNSIPRIILGSIFVVAFGLGSLPQDPARGRAGLLRGLLQRLPGRA